MKKTGVILTIACALLLTGCESTYYSAMEKLGIEKRDILIDRIENTQKAQQQTQAQFRDALEQYRAVINFEGGELEKVYNRLDREYQASEKTSSEIAVHIRKVENVSDDLFREWENELEMIKNTRLRQDSAKSLRHTRNRCRQLIKTMWRAEKSVHPVLDALRDQVYYLKHNLNARAISSLAGELGSIDADVSQLVSQMQKAINEANTFIATMKN